MPKTAEMAFPVPTKTFLPRSPDTAMLFAPFGCTHPPPLVPPFLLSQNLSPKDIAGCDIMKLKVSRCRYATSGLKGQISFHQRRRLQGREHYNTCGMQVLHKCVGNTLHRGAMLHHTALPSVSILWDSEFVLSTWEWMAICPLRKFWVDKLAACRDVCHLTDPCWVFCGRKALWWVVCCDCIN